MYMIQTMNKHLKKAFNHKLVYAQSVIQEFQMLKKSKNVTDVLITTIIV